jgi:2-polyprenyl-6-hydroxyphenyl methylase/3-demethylubiquinone-9 3-methyltransferase
LSDVGADALFDRDGWWDPACRAFASLRLVSEFRLALLERWLGGSWHDRTVVDLGCGGSLLGVPLAALGARVLGVDLATKALAAARHRGEARFLGAVGRLDRSPVCTASADFVLLADVLEHVDDPAAADAEAARLLRPGGRLFVNTINRTLRSRLFAIGLGEGLGLIPRGTHQWRMFVTPMELDHLAEDVGLLRVQRAGEAPRIWATLRRRAVVLRESKSVAVGYAALFAKGDA